MHSSCFRMLPLKSVEPVMTLMKKPTILMTMMKKESLSVSVATIRRHTANFTWKMRKMVEMSKAIMTCVTVPGEERRNEDMAIA